MKSHKDLEVWKRSIELVTILYEYTKEFPKEESYGLTSQIRRAAVSIPSNIAEGAARNHSKEFTQFLYIALGSISEIETHLIISEKLNYISSQKSSQIQNEVSEIRRMILGLIGSLSKHT